MKMQNDNEEAEPAYDVIELSDASSVTELSDSDGSDRFEIALQTLTKREQEVIRYRYGLVDDDVKECKDVADKFGISELRVKQIVTRFRRAFQGHRSWRRSKYLEDFLKESGNDQ